MASALQTLLGEGGAISGPSSFQQYLNQSAPSRPRSSAAKSTKKKHGGGFLTGVLNALSTPLAVVTSSAKEIGDLVDQATGNWHNQPGEKSQHASLSDWWSQIADVDKRIYGGDILRGSPEKGINEGVFTRKGHSGALPWQPPSPLTTALGLGLDIGLDPLSYVGGAGLVHGAEGAAAHVAEEGARQIAEVSGRTLSEEAIARIMAGEGRDLAAVSPEIASKVEEIRAATADAVQAARRGGASALSDAQLEQFGAGRLKKGLAFKLPGAPEIKLTSGNGPLGELSTARHSLQSHLGDVLLGEGGVPNRLGKVVANAENAAKARSGGPTEMLSAILENRARATQSNIADAAEKQAENLTLKAVKGYTDDEIQLARDAINGDPEALASAPPKLVQQLSDAFEAHGQLLVKGGVMPPEALMKAGSYFPSPIEKDARDALEVAGLAPAREDAPVAARSFVENRRKLWDPETKMGGIGRDAVDEATGTVISKRLTFTAANRKEAERKASGLLADELEAAAKDGGRAAEFLMEHPDMVQRLREGTYPLFQEPRAALVAQARAVGRRIGQAYAGRKMYEGGVGVLDPRRIKAAADTALSDAEIAHLGGQAAHFGQQAGDLGELSQLAHLHASEYGQPYSGVSPQSPLQGVLTPSTPTAVPGASPLTDVAAATAPAEPHALTQLSDAHARARAVLDEAPVEWGGETLPAGGQRELRSVAEDLGIDVKSFTGTAPEIMAKVRHAVEEEVARAAGYDHFLDYAIDHEVRAVEAAQQAKLRYDQFPNAAADVTESYSSRIISGGTRKLQRRASDAADQFLKPREEARRSLEDVERQIAEAGPEASTPASSRLRVAGKRLRENTAERERLASALEQKHGMDLTDAADRELRIANESPLPADAPDLQRRLRELEAQGRYNPQPGLLGEDRTLPEMVAPEDAAVTQQLTDRIAELDRQIERDRSILGNRPGEEAYGAAGPPLTPLDILHTKADELRAQIADYTRQMEDARSGMVASAATDVATAAETTPKLIRKVNPGSALDEAIGEAEAEIARLNAPPVEHFKSAEFAKQPFEIPEGLSAGKGLRAAAEGTLKPAAQSRVGGRQLAQRAEQIRAAWKDLGESVTTHEQAATDFRAYKAALDKVMPPSAERDVVALADTQVDQVGLMANDPSAIDTVADQVDRQMENAKRSGVVDPGYIEWAQKVQDGAKRWRILAKEARRVGDANLEEVARLHMVGYKLEALAQTATINHESRLRLWENAVTEATKGEGTLLRRGTLDYAGYRQLAPGILTPHEVADHVLFFDRLMYDPATQSQWQKSWQSTLHWMRVWQITSPGFHIRNAFGGVMNNMFYHVEPSSYRDIGSLMWKARAGGSLGDKQELWDRVLSIQTPGQIGSEAVGSPAGRLAGEASFGGSSTNPLKRLFGLTVGSKGVFPRISEAAGGEVEFFLRSSLAYDVMKKGGSLEDAVAAINHVHFDYHDLSLTEQKLKTNVIPFFTWTRHNVPLQLEQLLENPQVYARFQHARTEIEATSGADPVVPGYFADNLAIRLPFTKGGGHKYYMPDLPLRDLNLAVAPLGLVGGQGDLGHRFIDAFSEPLSQTTPLISGPIEWYMQRQVFKGLPLHDDRPVPLDWLHIPKWLQRPLMATPFVKFNGPTGRYYVSERDLYLLDKMLPVYARIRRLGGSNEPKMRDSLMGHLISFFGGAQVRTNTVDDQKIANYLRSLGTNTNDSITRRLDPNYDPTNGGRRKKSSSGLGRITGF